MRLSVHHQSRDLVSERLGSYSLTYREKHIVGLLLQGLSNKVIARACSITEQTV